MNLPDDNNSSHQVHTLMHRVLGAVADMVIRRYRSVVVVALLLATFAGWLATSIEINSNQVDLLSPDLKAIVELKKITKMTGGTGFLVLTLKADDKEHLKAATDALAAKLKAMREVRNVTFRQPTGFVRDNIGLYLETADLDTVRKRVKKKIRAEIRKQNPFAIELVKAKPVELNFDDLTEKYINMGKKGIADDYYISPERPEVAARYGHNYMMLLLVKPTGASTDLDFTRALLAKVEAEIAAYSANNDQAAVLGEAYGEVAPGATITYGFTGGYKLNLDDFDTIRDSVLPTSAVAALGIVVVLLFFLRGLRLVLLLQGALLLGVVFTFGVASVSVGKLNVISAVLACILQGLGVDYGIHFLYRLREEARLNSDLKESIRMAIIHSGAACATTAATTAAAFVVLSFSEFRGFRDFAVLSGIGVLLIATVMYVVLPALFLLVDSLRPGVGLRMLVAGTKDAGEHHARLRRAAFPLPRLVLLITVAITGVLGYFTQHAQFDYDARSLMVPQQPSIVLQNEVKERFQISADPSAIYCENFDDYRNLFDALNPLDREKYSAVDEVISVFSFLPPADQQQANAKLLARMRKDLKKVKRERLDEEEQQHYDDYARLLDAKPFGLDELPPSYRDQFQAVPEARAEYPGWLTFVYPKVALWDGRDLLAFDEQVSEITDTAGKTHYATGLAILFANLAIIVLHDGTMLTLLTSAVVFVLVLLSFRRLSATLVALLPLGLGLVWMFGMMPLVGVKLNFANMVVLTLIFGYGIDTGIHIYHRFWETKSVMIAVRMTGGAVMASMITALAGWGALSFANHRGIQSMGLLACLGIASALIVSLTLVPAILQLVSNRDARRDAGDQPQ